MPCEFLLQTFAITRVGIKRILIASSVPESGLGLTLAGAARASAEWILVALVERVLISCSVILIRLLSEGVCGPTVPPHLIILLFLLLISKDAIGRGDVLKLSFRFATCLVRVVLVRQLVVVDLDLFFVCSGRNAKNFVIVDL